jgi:DNA-binding transcriptional MerR regulator/methylmalonyl-CoA mutase cobalamin-binding subunit
MLGPRTPEKKARRRPERPTGRPSGPATPGEAHYSIRVTSRLTAVPLDTLRMWERRYGFPRPERTTGGSRVYREADVEALKLIRRALEQGYRPSEVVGKSLPELRQLVSVAAVAPVASANGGPTLATILAAVGRDDLAALRSELRQAAVMLGPKRFLVEVAHPLAVRVGELWADGKLEVRHEHLLTECLSAQLRVLGSTYEDRPDAPRVLLATLPGERHALGLGMAAVYLAASQVTPVLLGVDTPAPQIVRAALSHDVDAVALLVTAASDLKATAKDVHFMLTELPRRVGLWIGGAAAADLPIRDAAVRIVGTWPALDEAIAALARRRT